MNSSDYWKLFMDTGAPEMYLCYIKTREVEERNVSDG